MYVARFGLRKRLVHPSLEGPRWALTAQPPSLGPRGDTTSPGTRPPSRVPSEAPRAPSRPSGLSSRPVGGSLWVGTAPRRGLG